MNAACTKVHSLLTYTVAYYFQAALCCSSDTVYPSCLGEKFICISFLRGQGKFPPWPEKTSNQFVPIMTTVRPPPVHPGTCLMNHHFWPRPSELIIDNARNSVSHSPVLVCLNQSGREEQRVCCNTLQGVCVMCESSVFLPPSCTCRTLMYSCADKKKNVCDSVPVNSLSSLYLYLSFSGLWLINTMLNSDWMLWCVKTEILYSCARISYPVAEMQRCDNW